MHQYCDNRVYTPALTSGGWQEPGRGGEQLHRGGPEPVGDGAGHRDVDTLALLDAEEGVVTRRLW